MRILIITPFYSPDLGPSAPLFTLLSIQLVKRGNHVTVISAVPHYPTGIVNPDYRGSRLKRIVENGVNIIRVPVPSMDRQSLPKRLLQFFCFQIGSTRASFGLDYDVVIISNPALETLLPFIWQVVFRRKPTIFSIHDVYPDVGIKLGIFKHNYQVKAVALLERICLKKSSVIRILSESFRPGLRNLGVQDSKMVLIYDWVDTDLITPLSHVNEFRIINNLSNSFIVLYAGNIGFSQGLENLLLAADLLKENDNIKFIFVGSGSGLEHLKKQAIQMQLKNIQFIPFQPRERLPEVLASADVSLVILKRGIGVDSLPSKTFSILASGRPIIASVDEESETWNLVKKAEAGLCVPPENPGKIAEAILSLKNNKELCESLGKNGRIWAEKHHSPQHAAEHFENLCQKAISLHKQK